jgi:hypothetical protein
MQVDRPVDGATKVYAAVPRKNLARVLAVGHELRDPLVAVAGEDIAFLVVLRDDDSFGVAAIGLRYEAWISTYCPSTMTATPVLVQPQQLHSLSPRPLLSAHMYPPPRHGRQGVDTLTMTPIIPSWSTWEPEKEVTRLSQAGSSFGVWRHLFALCPSAAVHKT